MPKQQVNAYPRLPAPGRLDAPALEKLRSDEAERCVVFADWPALEPEENVYDEAAFDALRAELMAVGSLGAEPVLCLYRGADPDWFVSRGGWLREDNLRCYLRYVGRTARAVGHLAAEYITFYEPNAVIWQPPGGRPSLPGGVTALSNLACTHIRAVRLLRDTRAQRGLDDTAVGIVMRLYPEAVLLRALLRGAVTSTPSLYQRLPLLAMAKGDFRAPFRNTLCTQPGAWADFIGVTGAAEPERRVDCCARAEALTGIPARSVEE